MYHILGELYQSLDRALIGDRELAVLKRDDVALFDFSAVELAVARREGYKTGAYSVSRVKHYLSVALGGRIRVKV